MAQLSPHEKRNIFALLFVGAIPLGIAGYLSYLDADPNVQLPPRAAPPHPNGFDLYVKAADLSAQPDPPIDPASDPNSPNITVAQGAIRYGRTRREAWHQSAAPAWALFKRAQQTPTRDAYGYDTERMPGYASLRKLARDKSAEVRLFAMRGEPDRAVDSALDCVQMGFDTSREGSLISRLVASAICAIGISPLSETDGKNALQLPEQLSGPQARAAAARLEQLMARRPSYVAALQTERWMILSVVDRAFKRGDWRTPNAFGNAAPGNVVTIGGVPRAEPFEQRMARLLTPKRSVVAHIHQGFDDAIAEAKAPYKPIARVPDPNLPGSGALKIAPRPALDPISAQFIPGYYLRFNVAHEKTQFDLLLLRLTLQAYKAEKGVYPSNLNALAPAYLRQIPTDDFAGGQPYNYKSSGQTYRLWSIGPDTKNDGGKAIGFPKPTVGVPPRATPKLPWQQQLPSTLQDSTGDIVARETR